MDDGRDDLKARLEQLQRENDDLRDDLRRAESCLDQLQHLFDVGYWTHDLVTGEIWWSDHAFQVLEVERRPLDRAWILSMIHPDDVHILVEAMERSARGEPPDQHELRVITSSGKERVLSNRWVSRYDEEGNEVSRFGAHRDVTEDKRLQRERQQLREQLLHAQKMEAIGRLAGGVAHDFNNLLCAILGNAEMALLELDPEVSANAEARRDLRVVLDASKQAAVLTRQLLAISRQDLTKPSIVDVGQALTDLEDMIRRSVGERIRLHVVAESPGLCVSIDAAQLQQILLNLVVNSRDAMPEGGDLVIEVAEALLGEEYPSRRPASRRGRHVVLSVADTGVGMNEKVRAQIFEPYFTTKPVGEGTGLGLAAVRGIVEQWGGHIDVHSEPGRGATFKMYFPLSRDPATRPTTMVVAPSDPRGDETVLVCEDSAPVLELTQHILEGVGYEVIAARHPEEAIRLVEEGARPDLLVTDVVMPGLDGQQLAEALREELPALPVIFVSGHTGNVLARQRILDSDVDLLEKPFTRIDLLTVVRKVLDRQDG